MRLFDLIKLMITCHGRVDLKVVQKFYGISRILSSDQIHFF